jgi:hypothetical protein
MFFLKLVLLFSLFNPVVNENSLTDSDFECIRTDALKTINEVKVAKTRFDYKFDENGREMGHDLYWEDGRLKWAYDYEYNKDGLLSKKIRYDENRNYDGYYQLEYSSDGHLISEKYFNKKDELQSNKKYQTDEEGKPIRYDYFNRFNQKTEYWTFEYNDKGQNTKKNIYSANGKLDSTIKMYYDKRGNEFKYVRSRPEGKEMYTYYYSFICE